MVEAQNDGTTSWDGGCDMSRHPNAIGKNQYRMACNMILPKSNGGLSTRFGIHHVKLEYANNCDKETIEKGKFQAEGWFEESKSTYLCVAFSGWIFLLTETFSGTYKVTCLNATDQNNPEAAKGYFTRIPSGCIYNDGVSLPFYITSQGARRTKPENNEIGVGAMGVYLQNRFWYVTADFKEIKYSSFLDPLSTQESIDNNILGFVPPEDSDLITAIGAQKKMLNYAEGGNLVFSTSRNIYSIDVRGSSADWEEANTGVGKVQESIRGVSATSHNSFTTFNTNLYFRTRDHGVCDIRQSQYQFESSDDFTSQSIEVDALLEDDTPWMLDYCYTKTFQGRVFTTFAPEFNKDGRVFWNGLISYHPMPTYSGNARAARRFEGIFTGVRPWSLTSITDSANRPNQLFIWSNDIDGVNRLYQMKSDSWVDVNHHGKSIRIQGYVETRGYDHGNEYLRKQPISRVITLKDIGTNLKLSFLSKSESQSKFQLVCENNYLVETYKQAQDFSPVTGQRQQRCYQVLPEEKTEKESGKQSGIKYFYRTDRIEFTGDFTLDTFIRVASLERPDSSVSGSDKEPRFEEYDAPKMFTYHIATADP